jgi:hypothetical protein
MAKPQNKMAEMDTTTPAEGEAVYSPSAKEDSKAKALLSLFEKIYGRTPQKGCPATSCDFFG